MATAVEEKQPELEAIAIPAAVSPAPPPTTTATSSCTNPYEENSGDQFEKENSATVKYLGPGAAGGPTDGKTSGSDVSPSSGSENHHKTEGSITKATHRLVRQENNRMPYNQLLQMVARLEGELQARDIVIACLRNERVKSLLNHIRTRPDVPSSDPFAALFRDKLAIDGNFCNRDTSSLAVQAENEANIIINEQIEILYDMVTRQRQTHNRMVHILTESLENNQRMRQELEEEKRKHEHDTAQGDDITYGLEIERTKLKQELESERNQKKKLEKDLKELQKTLEFERNREKQMVLYLVAERKAIVKQYLEEGKKSQDLAQILNEEKQRSDTIAEGLEEESKKSSRIEAELEDKVASFDSERKQLKLNSAKDDKRIKELEGEILLLRNELDTYRKKLQQYQPSTGTKPRDEGVGMANVAKVVQPTATVSSVPVSGPTTGIARSLSVASGVQPHPPASAVTRLSTQQANAVNQAQGMRNPNASPPPKAINATGTILRAGEKQQQQPQQQQQPPSQNNSTGAVTTTTAPNTPATTTTGRGQPPPIPPNKPVVPPKREPSISRLNSVTLATAAAAAAASSNSSPTTNATATPTATATSTK